MGEQWNLLLFGFFAFLLTSTGIISDSFATSEITLNPPENPVQWESLEIQFWDDQKIGVVTVEVWNGSTLLDSISALQLLNDSQDPPELFHGKIMLSNPNKVGSTPEILDNVSTQPGNRVLVKHDTLSEEVTVIAQGTYYPNGTRNSGIEKLDPNCTDDEGDGICDEWETGDLVIVNGTNTYTFDCSIGCTSTSKDIFIELDYMEGHHPDPRAIAEVENIFATRNINLHIQIDESPAILHNGVLGFPGYEIENMPQYNGFDQLKGNQFGTESERASYGTNPSDPNEGALIDSISDLKHQAFHYGFLNHERQWNSGESGIGEINGNDFMISMGSYSGFVGSADQQAGTLMHELGHNLSLLHGGGDSINYKPNYFSVMNYARQMPDFDPNRLLDFSGKVLGHDHTPGKLVEDNLIESPVGLDSYVDENIDHDNENVIFFCNSGAQAGLHFNPGGPVNWNCNSSLDTYQTSGNINNGANSSPMPANEILDGWNDWDTLNYRFIDSSDFDDGVHNNNGNGNAGEDTREVHGNPFGIPPGLSNYRGPPDLKFNFVSQEEELTIQDVISNRIGALLTLRSELQQIPNDEFHGSFNGISFDESLHSTPEIIKVQTISPYKELPPLSSLPSKFTQKSLEDFAGEKSPSNLSIKGLYLWGVEKAIDQTNHHDIKRTKFIVQLIDVGLKISLSDEDYKRISPTIDNLVDSYENSLDFVKTEYHSEDHKRVSEPIVDPKEVDLMIKNVDVAATADSDCDGIADIQDKEPMSSPGCDDSGVVIPVDSVSISVPQETSSPGCEETNECFIPFEVAVNVGGVVTWSNDDSAAHTVTAGSAADGPSGVFDSSLFMAGTTFSHTFDAEGEFPYFCMVHPWMQGIVLVGTAMNTELKITLDHDITGGTITNISPDTDARSLIIELDTTNQGELTVTLPRDIIDSTINDEDNNFFVIIDGEEVIYEETKTSAERTLTIQFPAGAKEIEIIGTFVVPEFGTIAAMILAIAIISIVVVSAKSRLSIMPRL